MSNFRELSGATREQVNEAVASAFGITVLPATPAEILSALQSLGYPKARACYSVAITLNDGLNAVIELNETVTDEASFWTLVEQWLNEPDEKE